MDYLLLILTKCGIDWTFRVHEDAFDADMLEFNTVDQYKYPQKRVDLIEATKRSNVCIISSREIMVHSHMVSQNCHTKVYHVSEFSKKMQDKGRDLKQLTSWDDAVNGAISAHDLFNKILLEQMKSFDYAENVLGLDQLDIRILCALYDKRTIALRMKDIAAITMTDTRKMYLKKNMQKLMDQKLVATDEKDPGKMWHIGTFFIITTAGLDKIINYRKYVYKNLF